MSSRAARAGRGWLIAAVATVAAAVSHAIADGALPSGLGVVASVVIAGAASTLLVGRTVSLVRLTASVAVAQVLFHGLFSGAVDPAPADGHAHTFGTQIAAMPEPHHGSGMWLAHVVAGAIALVLLRHGETALVALGRGIRLLAQRLYRVPRAPEITGPRTRPVAPARPAGPALRVSRTPLVRRGPPPPVAV